MYDPSIDELYTAVRGRGAWCNGRPLRVAATGSIAEALVVTQAQSADPAAIAAFCDLMGLLMNLTAGVRLPGAPALVLAHVAAGRFTAYVEPDMDPCDIAAGRLLVEEAGGRVTDFTGRPPGNTGRTHLVASNGHVHDRLLAALPGAAVPDAQAVEGAAT